MEDKSGDITVGEMPETEDFLQTYTQSIQKMCQQNLLPDMDQTVPYRVYRLKGKSFGAHESIVLSHGGKFFTMELGFISEEGNQYIYPVTRAYEGPEDKLEYCGEVTKSGNELLARGIHLMQKFGTYYKCLNNCQNYCNAYLCDIGLGDKKKLTDPQKSFLMGASATIVAGIGYVVFQMLQQRSQHQ